MHYGQHNSGPAREIWRAGDRVTVVERGRRVTGTVAAPPRERNAAETHSVWVRWDDGETSFADPNNLNPAR